MSWWTRRRGPRQRARATRAGSRQRLEEVAADDPEHVEVARGRVRRPSRSPSSPGASGTAKPHSVAPPLGASPVDRRARSRPRRRPGRRSGRGSAPGRVPARPSKPRARPTFIERLDRVDAVGVLREPHRPDEHARSAARRAGARTPRIRSRGRAALALELGPRDGQRRRAFASSNPSVALATNASSTPPRSIERLRSTPTRNARSPPVSHVEPVVRESRAEERARRRSTESSSARGRARGTG